MEPLTFLGKRYILWFKKRWDRYKLRLESWCGGGKFRCLFALWRNCAAAESINFPPAPVRTFSACFKLEEDRDKFSLGWRSASSAAIKFQAEPFPKPPRCFMAAPPPRQHRTQRLLHHRIHLSKTKPIPVRRTAQLFVGVLQHYRLQEKYLLHQFVLMPDHFHLLITPALTLERAMQLIKGGFLSSG